MRHTEADGGRQEHSEGRELDAGHCHMPVSQMGQAPHSVPSDTLPVHDAGAVPTSLLAAGLHDGNNYCSASPRLTAPNPSCSANLDIFSPGVLVMVCCLAAEVTPTFLFQSQVRGASGLQELSVSKPHRVVMNFLQAARANQRVLYGA